MLTKNKAKKTTPKKRAPIKKKTAPKKKALVKKTASKRKIPAKKKKTRKKARKNPTRASSKPRKATGKQSLMDDTIALHKDGSEKDGSYMDLFNAIPNYAGRPRKHSIKMEDDICKLISLGFSLSKICGYPDMPDISTVFAWLNDEDKEGFSDKYIRARAAQAEIIEDSVIDIADNAANPVLNKEREPFILPNGQPLMITDNAAVQHARLRIDTRHRHLEIVKPKKWGRDAGLGEGTGLGLLALMDQAATRLAQHREKEKQSALIDNDSGKVVNN